MRVMLLMVPRDAAAPAAPAAIDAAGMTEAIAKYDETLRRAGVLLARDALEPAARGARVSFEHGRAQVRDGAAGPVPRAYWMLQVRSTDEAIEWASRCPAVSDALIEVCPVQETMRP